MSLFNIGLLIVVIWILLYSLVDRICSCAQICTHLKYCVSCGKSDGDMDLYKTKGDCDETRRC